MDNFLERGFGQRGVFWAWGYFKQVKLINLISRNVDHLVRAFNLFSVKEGIFGYRGILGQGNFWG